MIQAVYNTSRIICNTAQAIYNISYMTYAAAQALYNSPQAMDHTSRAISNAIAPPVVAIMPVSTITTNTMDTTVRLCIFTIGKMSTALGEWCAGLVLCSPTILEQTAAYIQDNLALIFLRTTVILLPLLILKPFLYLLSLYITRRYVPSL